MECEHYMVQEGKQCTINIFITYRVYQVISDHIYYFCVHMLNLSLYSVLITFTILVSAPNCSLRHGHQLEVLC
jgi:hypothetical protein